MPHSRRRRRASASQSATPLATAAAEVEAPESGVSGGPLHKRLRRGERGQQDQGTGALQAKDQLIAGGGWRRGQYQHPFPIMQIASAGAVAIAKDALRPRAIAAQRPVVNGQMVDESGAQLQPTRLPGKPRARQLAAQPPGFSRITKGGSAGWWRAGPWAGRRSDRPSSGRWRPRTTGPGYQCPLARRRLRLWGDQQQE